MGLIRLVQGLLQASLKKNDRDNTIISVKGLFKGLTVIKHGSSKVNRYGQTNNSIVSL